MGRERTKEDWENISDKAIAKRKSVTKSFEYGEVYNPRVSEEDKQRIMSLVNGPGLLR